MFAQQCTDSVFGYSFLFLFFGEDGQVSYILIFPKLLHLHVYKPYTRFSENNGEQKDKRLSDIQDNPWSNNCLH